MTGLIRVLIVCLWAVFPGVVLAGQEGADPRPTEAASEPPESGEAEPETGVDPRFETPDATIRTFLAATDRIRQATGSERTAALEDARECFAVETMGTAEASIDVPRIQQLRSVLEWVEVELAYWPMLEDEDRGSTVAYPNPALDEHRRLRVAANTRDAEVVLVRTEAGAWKFSQGTIDDLPVLWRRLHQYFGDDGAELTLSMWIRSQIPLELQTTRFLTIEAWQWIGIFVILLLGFTLDMSVRLALRAAWGRYQAKRGVETEQRVVVRAVRPFGLFAAAVLWFWTLALLDLPPTALEVLRVAVRLFLMLASVLAGFRVIDLVAAFATAKAEQTSTKFDDLLVPLGRKTVKVFLAVMGGIYIAQSFSIEILPLLTGLGIGGLAFAFAAKDTIENFFGSVAVILDRPFEVGDWVQIGDTEGTVEELGLRSVRVRTFYNSLVTIPNATLVRATVDNYGRRRYRRFKTNLSVTYDTPPERIEAFCEGIRELVRVHPYTRKDYFHVWLNGFAPASLDVLVYVFHECPDWGTELRERQRLMLDIIRLARRLGVEFAFPTQTIHVPGLERLAPDSGASVEVPPGVTDEERNAEDGGDIPAKLGEQRARARGRRAARQLVANQSWREGDPPPPLSFGEDAHLDDLPTVDEEPEE